MIRKTFECSVKAEAREGEATRFRAIASTGAQDRHGEFLEPTGARLIAGAPVLYGHDYWSITSNIGVCLSMSLEGGAVVVEGEFDDLIPEHTNAVIAAKKAKKTPSSLNTLSVGFQPRAVKFKDGKVQRLGPGEFVWPEPGLTYTEWDLVELSFVPVPANPEAELLSARSAAAGLAGEGGPGELRGILARALEDVFASPEFGRRVARLKLEAEAPPAVAVGEPGTPAADLEPAPVPPADELEALLAEPEPIEEDEVAELLAEDAGPSGAGEGADDTSAG